MIGPIHPGVTLREDFMEPHGLSANRLARALGIPQNRISDIARGRRGITADTALRLERAFGVSAAFWLNLQSHYELEVAERDNGAAIRQAVRRVESVAGRSPVHGERLTWRPLRSGFRTPSGTGWRRWRPGAA